MIDHTQMYAPLFRANSCHVTYTIAQHKCCKFYSVGNVQDHFRGWYCNPLTNLSITYHEKKLIILLHFIIEAQTDQQIKMLIPFYRHDDYSIGLSFSQSLMCENKVYYGGIFSSSPPWSMFEIVSHRCILLSCMVFVMAPSLSLIPEEQNRKRNQNRICGNSTGQNYNKKPMIMLT